MQDHHKNSADTQTIIGSVVTRESLVFLTIDILNCNKYYSKFCGPTLQQKRVKSPKMSKILQKKRFKIRVMGDPQNNEF